MKKLVSKRFYLLCIFVFISIHGAFGQTFNVSRYEPRGNGFVWEGIVMEGNFASDIIQGEANPTVKAQLNLRSGKVVGYKYQGKIYPYQPVEGTQWPWVSNGFEVSGAIYESNKKIADFKDYIGLNLSPIIRSVEVDGGNFNDYNFQFRNIEILPDESDANNRKIQSYLDAQKKQVEQQKELSQLSGQLAAATDKTEAESVLNTIKTTRWVEELQPQAKQIEERALGKIKELEETMAQIKENYAEGIYGDARQGEGDENSSNEQESISQQRQREAREAERMHKYNVAMEKVRAAESKGNKRAALAAYKEANRYNSTQETRSKISYLAGSLMAQDAARAITSLFVDSNSQIDKWTSDIEARREKEKNQIDIYKRNLVNKSRSLLEYSIKTYYLLTEDENVKAGGISNPPPVTTVKNEQTIYNIDKVLTEQKGLPVQERSDSIYMFAYFPNKESYKGPLPLTGAYYNVAMSSLNLAISRQYGTRLPSNPINEAKLQEIRSYPFLEICHTDISALPTEALLEIDKNLKGNPAYKTEDIILRSLKPCKFTDDNQDKNKPLLITSDSREYLEQLKKQLTEQTDAIKITQGSYNSEIDLNNLLDFSETKVIKSSQANNVQNAQIKEETLNWLRQNGPQYTIAYAYLDKKNSEYIEYEFHEDRIEQKYIVWLREVGNKEPYSYVISYFDLFYKDILYVEDLSTLVKGKMSDNYLDYTFVRIPVKKQYSGKDKYFSRGKIKGENIYYEEKNYKYYFFYYLTKDENAEKNLYQILKQIMQMAKLSGAEEYQDQGTED